MKAGTPFQESDAMQGARQELLAIVEELMGARARMRRVQQRLKAAARSAEPVVVEPGGHNLTREEWLAENLAEVASMEVNETIRVLRSLARRNLDREIRSFAAKEWGFEKRRQAASRRSDSVGSACPSCGSVDVLPIIWGRPLPEDFEREERGEVVLGGCIVTGNVLAAAGN